MMQRARAGELQRSVEDQNLAGRTELYWIFAVAAFLLGLREMVMLVRQWRRLRPREGAWS